MPLCDAAVRNKNFEEVALGYTEEAAVREAKRCLKCKSRPCVSGCPVSVCVPDFLAAVAEKNFEKAYEIITCENVLPAVTGRVCPQENQCEKHCVRGLKGEPVAIGNLERFVADRHRLSAEKRDNEEGHETRAEVGYRDFCRGCSAFPIMCAKCKNQNGNRYKNKVAVAIVGSGPCGLACAGELIARGYAVTVYEALHRTGGVLIYGIPEFRLPKSIVKAETDRLERDGVRFVADAVCGKAFSVDELFEGGYLAVFIASGAGLPKFMNIPGESAAGVCSANEFLTRVNLMNARSDSAKTPVDKGGKVFVVGGGNVAMDAARCALRLGGDVTVIYRRTESELPARREEVLHAKEEGVKFEFLTNPVKIIAEKGRAVGVVLQKMRLGEPDASGRRSPVPVENSEYSVACDEVIMALGTSPNPLITRTSNIASDKHGCITVDENGATSKDGVFAGGDAATGAATVIMAMGAGKKAAAGIDEYIKNRF